MRKQVWYLLIALALVLSANFSLAQAPLGGGTNYLTCVNYNDDFGSSDMTLIVQLEVEGTIVVNEGHEVTYVFLRMADNARGDSLGLKWVSPNFDDSGWDGGISGVGYSDGDDNTEVTRENAAGARDGLAIYTRYRFDLASSAGVGSVVLRVDYDDGYACWLNGTEIARSANVDGKDLTWDASLGGIANHGSTELAKGTPNTARNYQEEIPVDFVSVSVAVKPAGKLATSWGKVKASY